MAEIPFLLFDADDHYDEALDAFTRHIEPGFEKRWMQWAPRGADPAGYAEELSGFSEREIRLVMRDDALALSQRRPTSAA